MKRKTKKTMVTTPYQGMSQDDIQRIVDTEVEKEVERRQDSLFNEMQMMIIAVLVIALFILFVLGFTPILSVSDPTGWVNSANIFRTVFLYSVVFFVIILVFLTAFKKKIGKPKRLIITKPEIQIPKIRNWATEHFGIRLGQCVNIGCSPQSGDGSAVPHTLHFKFEVLKRGLFYGYAWIDNKLMIDNNVFHMRNIKTWDRDTYNKMWHGEPKQKQPIKIVQDTTETRKSMQYDTQEDVEEGTGATE